ncbi:MAG: hypothetical protein AB8G18_01970 [Gammaproteobacteria bacterium]
MTVSDDVDLEMGETTRRVLALSNDVRSATLDVVKSARRSLSIFSHDLDPSVYDRIEFLDAVKKLILTHKFSRIQILIISPVGAVKNGHRLIELARRFSTFFEIRRVNPEYAKRNDAFLIADETGVVYRLNSKRWEGIADTNAPRIAQKYLDLFEEAWQRSEPEPEFRQLMI